MSESVRFTAAQMFHEDYQKEFNDGNTQNVDLHTHLLGCGDHAFWVEEVMKIHLTKRFSFAAGSEDIHVNEYPPLMIFDDRTNEFIPIEESARLLKQLRNEESLLELHRSLRELKDKPNAKEKRGSFPTYFEDSPEALLSKVGESQTFRVEIPGNAFAQVGWVREGFTCDHSYYGCGDDLNSWALDGLRSLKWNQNCPEICRLALQEGDILETKCNIIDNGRANITFQIRPRDGTSTLKEEFLGVEFNKYLRFAITCSKLDRIPSVQKEKENKAGERHVSDVKLVRCAVNSDGAFHACFESFMNKVEFRDSHMFAKLFRKNFTQDVVYPDHTIADAFCLPKYEENVRRNYVLERLGCTHDIFKPYIVFDARQQQFSFIEKGISNTELLAIYNSNEISKGFVLNAFAMLSPDGEQAGLRDLAAYRGHFTPEFYPGRFALKDPIYSQRLDILHRLLEHLENRGIQSLVNYFELSIGVGDASRRHVMAFLSKRVADATKLDGALICELKSKCHRATFKYLAYVQILGRVQSSRGQAGLGPSKYPELFETSGWRDSALICVS